MPCHLYTANPSVGGQQIIGHGCNDRDAMLNYCEVFDSFFVETTPDGTLLATKQGKEAIVWSLFPDIQQKLANLPKKETTVAKGRRRPSVSRKIRNAQGELGNAEPSPQPSPEPAANDDSPSYEETRFASGTERKEFDPKNGTNAAQPSPAVTVIPQETQAERIGRLRQKLRDKLALQKAQGVKSPDDYQVMVIKDTSISYEKLYLDVFIAGNRDDRRSFAEMFGRANCSAVDNPRNADLVVFTGGVDVNPALYDEKPHSQTYWHDERDLADIELYMVCHSLGIPMLGICRGAQFLHVMNGGKLFQHIDNHNGNHAMWDQVGKIRLEKVSSVHHQSVRMNSAGNMRIIATCSESSERHLNDKVMQDGAAPDIEAFIYPDTLSLGIQGHPEYKGYNFFTNWVLKQINYWFLENPSVEHVKGNRRLAEDCLKLRKSELPASVTKFISDYQIKIKAAKPKGK